jgi:outer membrane protein assembly factor BamB
MRRMALVLSGFLLLLAACGGDDADTVTPTDGAAGAAKPGGDKPAAEGGDVEPGADGTLWGVTSTLALIGVDLATGEELFPPSLDQIVEPFTPLQSIAVVDGRVWLVTGDESAVTGGDGGAALVIDPETGDVVDTLEFAGGVRVLAGDGGEVYIAHSTEDDSPVVERYDAATLASEAQARVLEDNPSHTVEAMVPDGDTLWVLQGNGFALHKVDAATLAVQETVRLGRFEDGPFGDLYGYGKMVQVGDVLWIVDTYNNDLLRVDKASLQPEVVGSIDEHVIGRVQLSANSDSFFLATGDDSAGRVVRFDGGTGEEVATYELGEDGARAFAIDDDHLYVNDDYLGDLAEIDIETGETQRTLPVPGPQVVAVDAG